jgi:hypothetical protein
MNLIVIIMAIIFIGLLFLNPFEFQKLERLLLLLVISILLFLVSLINYLICGYFIVWHSFIGMENKEDLKKLVKEQGFKISFYTGFIGDTFFQATILNILRGFIFIASFIIIFSFFHFIFNLIGLTGFLERLFNYNHIEKYIAPTDFIGLLSFNYYFDAAIFYIIGYFTRYSSPKSMFGWIDTYENKLHLPYVDTFRKFENNPFEYDWERRYADEYDED